jgi:hypothetical protein
MKCTKCSAGYGGPNTAESKCIKCPTNCDECTASGTTSKCSKCKSGYAKSSDSSACNACSSAAFANCATCGDGDKAECNTCVSGFQLKDGRKTTECIDVSAKSSCSVIVDAPPTCSACKQDYMPSDNKEKCLLRCFKCGTITSDAVTSVDKSACIVDSNSTSAVYDDCSAGGVCVGLFDKATSKVAAGCVPPTHPNYATCTGPPAVGESCNATLNGCVQCCTSDKCNIFVNQLDGVEDAATTVHLSIALILASVLATLI